MTNNSGNVLSTDGRYWLNQVLPTR